MYMYADASPAVFLVLNVITYSQTPLHIRTYLEVCTCRPIQQATAGSVEQ